MHFTNFCQAISLSLFSTSRLFVAKPHAFIRAPMFVIILSTELCTKIAVNIPSILIHTCMYRYMQLLKWTIFDSLLAMFVSSKKGWYGFLLLLFFFSPFFLTTLHWARNYKPIIPCSELLVIQETWDRSCDFHIG